MKFLSLFTVVSLSLLARQADVDRKDGSGQTLLMRAAHRFLPAEQIRNLLSEGANPRLRDRAGETALNDVAWSAQYDFTVGGAEESHAEAVHALVHAGADVNASGAGGITPLMRAAGWRHEPTLRALLAEGAEINRRDSLGRTALTWAANEGRSSGIVRALLRAGAQIDPASAMLLNDFRTARALIARTKTGAGAGPYGESLLMIAAEKSLPDIVRTLLQRGASVYARDEEGMTALILAVGGRPVQSIPSGTRSWTAPGTAKTRAEVVRVLLAHHADVQAANLRHDTALTTAQETKDAPVLRLLESAGAPTETPAR